MTILDELERLIFEAEHAEFLRAHDQPASRENLDGAWRVATDFPSCGRRARARAAAVAILQRFTIVPPDGTCHSLPAA